MIKKAAFLLLFFYYLAQYGYKISLINYNKNVNKTGFGLMLTR